MLPFIRQAQGWTAPHVCLACRRQLALAASRKSSTIRDEALLSVPTIITRQSAARRSSSRPIGSRAYHQSVRWLSEVTAAAERADDADGRAAAVHVSEKAPDASHAESSNASESLSSESSVSGDGEDKPSPKPKARSKRRAKRRIRRIITAQQKEELTTKSNVANKKKKKDKNKAKKMVMDSKSPSADENVAHNQKDAQAKADDQALGEVAEASDAGSAVRRVVCSKPGGRRSRARRTRSKAARSATGVQPGKESEQPEMVSAPAEQPTGMDKQPTPAKRSKKAKSESVKQPAELKNGLDAAKLNPTATKQSKKAKKRAAAAAAAKSVGSQEQSAEDTGAESKEGAASPSDDSSPGGLTPKQAKKSGRAGVDEKLSKRAKARQRTTGPNAIQNWTKGITKHMEEVVTSSLIGGQVEITPIDVVQPPIPRLAHQLDRVLFNPGIYHLKDPYTGVYSFDPYLEKVMPVEEFDFGALKQYRTSSEDNTLSNLARARGKKFVGSTSSMTSVLGQFHFLLSCFRPVNTSMLSRGFTPDSDRFTKIARAPQSIFLRWQNGTYAIDADKEFDTPNILMLLGKSMEKLLTMSKPEFERYRKSNPETVPEEERTAEEPFQYSESGDLLMRSQLDSYDPRLQRNGTFDLKTRTVLSIRMDHGSEESRGYEIMQAQGQYMSYEREYFDMLRATMLKYMLQVRIGRMEGIFVAYHNIERIFGFQYISLHEIDRALHGQSDTNLGDLEFGMSLHMLNEQLNRATAKFPEQSLRITFEATGMDDKAALLVFAEPMSDEDIDAVQHRAKKSAIDYENRVLRGELDVTIPKQKSDKETAPNPTDTTAAPSTEDGQVESTEASGQPAEEAEAVRDNALEREQDSSKSVPTPESTLQETLTQLETPVDDIRPSPSSGEASADVETNGACSEVTETGMEEFPDPRTSSRVSIAFRSATDHVSESAQVSETVPTEGDHAASATPADRVNAADEADQQSNVDEPAHAEETQSTTQNSSDTVNKSSTKAPKVVCKPLYAAVVTTQQFINQSPVVRPRSCRSGTEWKVDYQVWEYPEEKLERAWKSYEASRARRKKIFTAHAKGDDGDGPTKETVDYYIRKLRKLAEEGRKWRKKTEELNKDKPIQVWSQ